MRFPIRDLTDQDRERLKARQKEIFRNGMPAIRRAPLARRMANAARAAAEKASRQAQVPGSAAAQRQSRSFYNTVEVYGAPPERFGGPVSRPIVNPNPWSSEQWSSNPWASGQ